MMAGILLCANIPKRLLLPLVILFAASGCALAAFKRYRLALLALSALTGLAFAAIALPADFDFERARVEGAVCEIEAGEGESLLTLERAKLNGAPFNKRVRLKVKAGSALAPRIGDIIEADAFVRKPDRRFGTYDERKSMLASGIGCIASAESFSVKGEHALPLAELVHGIRDAAEQRIRLAFGEDSGIFSALLLGVRTELSEERAEAYRASGTAHLLAISGFHMGIIAGAVSALVPKRRRVLKLIVVALAAGLYCTVAAYTPGIVRAAIMTVCVLASGALERRADTLSALSLAAMIILGFNPFQIYSLGFQFSFSAVFGIALFYRSFTEGLNKARLPSALASAISVCLAATAGTLMLQLRYYSSLAPYTLIANLIAVPAFSAVVMLALVCTLLAFVLPGAAQLAAIVPRGILFAVESALRLLSKLPLASVELSPPSSVCCLIYLVLLFALSEYVLRPFKKRLEFALPLLILFTFAYITGIIKA